MAGDATDTTDVDTEGDDAFNGAFESSQEPTTTPAESSTSEAQPEARPTPRPAPPPAPEYVQIARQEWEDLSQRTAGFSAADFKRQLDTANGTIGGLKQRLEQIGKAGPMEVSVADFQELASEYGTEMAQQIAAGLTRAMGRNRPAEQAQQAQTTTPAPAVDPLRQQLIDAHLDAIVDGPDWRTNPAEQKSLGAWIAKQPPQVQALAASDDVRDAAALLRAYAKDKQTPAKPSTRQRQLQAAVNPRGSSGGAPPAADADDPFDAGFSAPIPRRR